MSEVEDSRRRMYDRLRRGVCECGGAVEVCPCRATSGHQTAHPTRHLRCAKPCGSWWIEEESFAAFVCGQNHWEPGVGPLIVEDLL